LGQTGRTGVQVRR